MLCFVQEQNVNATTQLEKVLKALNSDPDTLLLMGQLLPNVTTGIPSQQRLDLLKEGAMHHILNPAIQVPTQTHQRFLELTKEQCCCHFPPRNPESVRNATKVTVSPSNSLHIL